MTRQDPAPSDPAPSDATPSDRAPSDRARSFLAGLPLIGPFLSRWAGRRGSGPLGRLLASTGWMERDVVAIMAFASLATYVFVKLAAEVTEGETGGFDRALLLALRNPADPSDPIGPLWFEEVMRDFTALGGTAVLTLVTLCVIAFLLLTKRHGTAALVAACVIGGTVLSSLLKWGFDRPRPDLVPHGVAVYTQSFPSSHAMMSAAIYLTLGALLARTQSRIRVKIFLLGIAAFVTVLVGVSRVYLGVHWPTDVLAGWAGGAAWAALCWLVMLYLQARGKVEAEGVGGLPEGRPGS